MACFRAGILKLIFTHASTEKPDWLIMESSTRTMREDLRLASALKEAFGTQLIFTGQHPMAHPGRGPESCGLRMHWRI